jgi:type IV pilus assembly protein PilA
MIVVAIVGIVAAIALVGFRKYQASAAAGEARAMLQTIRGAEDAYKAETLTYLSCPGPPGAAALSITGVNYYPRTKAQLDTDGDKKAAWGGWPGEACWKTLNVTSTGPVRFSFAVVSGDPGVVTVNDPIGTITNWPFNAGANSNSPWFVAGALGNMDTDTKYSYLWTSSFNGDVGVYDDTE